jgi:hypothetical protein
MYLGKDSYPPRRPPPPFPLLLPPPRSPAISIWYGFLISIRLAEAYLIKCYDLK